MFNKCFDCFFMFCISCMITGCSTIFSAQEWSNNYALMDGVQSTSPEMIDGNFETIGEAALTLTSNNKEYAAKVSAAKDNAEFFRNDSIVVVSLPERKKIYRIILHSDNLKHFVVYVNEGKRAKGENWEHIIEMRDVRSKIIDLKLRKPYYTNQIKIRIVRTYNLPVQKSKTFRLSTLLGSGNLDRTVISNISTPMHRPGRIREIEIYGFKTAEQN